MSDAKTALVVVPTYNEAGSIEEVVERLFAATGDSIDLLVVDDSSSDGTGEIAGRLASERACIHVLHRPVKTGLGDAYVDGFNWAMERGYPAVVEMDADLSHDPAIVPKLIGDLAICDLVIGSRYVPGGKVENWSGFRRALSRAGNAYARRLLGYGVRDSTAGFRAYRTEWLRTQDLSTVSSRGYAFQIEMTRRAHRSGARIGEIPITFSERTTGESKMSRRIVFEALLQVTRWGLNDLFRRKTG